MPLAFSVGEPFTATPMNPPLVPSQLFQCRCMLFAKLCEGSGCFIQHAAQLSHLLTGFRGASLGCFSVPFGVGELTLTLGSFSKSGQQQALALAQVVRQEVGVIHHAHCCTDFYQSRKSALEKYI
jgi:hypothetical protein